MRTSRSLLDKDRQRREDVPAARVQWVIEPQRSSDHWNEAMRCVDSFASRKNRSRRHSHSTVPLLIRDPDQQNRQGCIRLPPAIERIGYSILCIYPRLTILSRSSVRSVVRPMPDRTPSESDASCVCSTDRFLSVEASRGSRNLTWDGRVYRFDRCCVGRISSTMAGSSTGACSSVLLSISACIPAITASIRFGSSSLGIDDVNGKEFSARSR